ncbi:hypothetical protein [Streptomyces sp. MNU89]|nr:hypothetical protein [Streptomyces sp. MNU89]
MTDRQAANRRSDTARAICTGAASGAVRALVAWILRMLWGDTTSE